MPCILRGLRQIKFENLGKSVFWQNKYQDYIIYSSPYFCTCLSEVHTYTPCTLNYSHSLLQVGFNNVWSHLKKRVIRLLMEWHHNNSRRQRKQKANQLLSIWNYWKTNAQASPQKVFLVLKNTVEPFQKCINILSPG